MQAKAVLIEGKGDVDVLKLGTIALRDPGPGEVLVEVQAAGLNRADTLQRRGFYPAPPGAIANVPGLEYAGVVSAVGSEVRGAKPSDRVMGIVAGGGMASHVVVHERELIRVPAQLSIEDAAAIPEVFLTAYDALFPQAGLGLSDVLLVHAIGSGVGTAALQLAHATSARVIGTSRTADKLERAQAFGLARSDGICVAENRFAERVRELTGGRGADVILDSIGAAYIAENVAAVAELGRVVIIGLMGGATGEVPLGLLLAKRASVRGTVLRARPLEQKASLAQAFMRDVIPLFERGTCKPVVECVLPMTEIAEAHRRMERNENFGKIVLRW